MRTIPAAAIGIMSGLSAAAVLLFAGRHVFRSAGQYVQTGARELRLYTPSVNEQREFLQTETVSVQSPLALEAVLDTLGARLSSGYFSNFAGRDTDIRFEALSVNTIETPSPLRVGVLNIIDTARVAMTTFFQGSAGARMTFAVLCGTFLQPGRDPLLAGVVFLYNGELIPALDHIDLSGIQVPEEAERAIRGIGLLER